MIVQLNDLYYKTTILTNLAIAVIVNYETNVIIYDHNVRYKLKHNLLS